MSLGIEDFRFHELPSDDWEARERRTSRLVAANSREIFDWKLIETVLRCRSSRDEASRCDGWKHGESRPGDDGEDGMRGERRRFHHGRRLEGGVRTRHREFRDIIGASWELIKDDEALRRKIGKEGFSSQHPHSSSSLLRWIHLSPTFILASYSHYISDAVRKVRSCTSYTGGSFEQLRDPLGEGRRGSASKLILRYIRS